MIAALQSTESRLGLDTTAIVMVQGEEDAVAIDNSVIVGDDYQNELIDVIAMYRSALDANLPFFIIRTARQVSGDTTGYQTIRARQEAVAASVPNVYIASTKALDIVNDGMTVDNVHWNQAGLNIVGTDAGTNVANILEGL